MSTDTPPTDTQGDERLTSAEREALRHCPVCGHDWSGHCDDEQIAAHLGCRGQRGLGSVTGCRCKMNLARAVERILADRVRPVPAATHTDEECAEHVRLAVEQEREHGLDLHRAYRPEVAAEVCVHLGSHESWEALAEWCGGFISTEQDPSGEYTSTLVLPDGQAGGQWSWLCRDATGAFKIRAEVEQVTPSPEVVRLAAATHTDPAAQALRDAADALNNDAVGFKSDGWGSNPVDQQTLAFGTWVLSWLRERADRLAAQAPATPGTRTVTVTVYTDEPGPDVTEVEDRNGHVWDRRGDRWRKRLAFEAGPEWRFVTIVESAGPVVPVGTRARLRGDS